MATHTVQSPLPGVFYRRPDPTKPAYVEEGAEVTADQTIALVEIMKQFAEIKAGVDGTLVAFAVQDGDVLGPGDAIATVEVA